MSDVLGQTTKGWSKEEDEALRAFYPRHGMTWDGWAEVLPERTQVAISTRASRLGLAQNKREGRQRSKRPMKMPTKDQSGYDGYVRRCMHEGMAPSQIDSMMGWWPGKTIRILTTIWNRESEN